jgi:hypothetical protein
MATIVLKLVGQLKNDYIIKSSTIDFKIDDLKRCFNIKNINEKDFSEIKFISNGSKLNDYKDNLVTKEKPEIIIYMFVTDKILLEKVISNIFSFEQEQKPISIIDTNTPTINLCKDPAFLTLLRICIEKPEYFNKVANYITNGNISYKIKMIIEEDFTYNTELEELHKILLNINICRNDIVLKSVLQHFEGNLNMSLRYIISNTP